MASVEGEGRGGGESTEYERIDSCSLALARGRVVENKVWPGLRCCIDAREMPRYRLWRGTGSGPGEGEYTRGGRCRTVVPIRSWEDEADGQCRGTVAVSGIGPTACLSVGVGSAR